MKNTIVTTILVASFSTTAAAQRAPSRQVLDKAAIDKAAIKEVQVTPQAVAKQRTVIDLTRGGTMYTLPSGVDYTRVVVRTANGEATLAELITKSGKKITGNLQAGHDS